MKRIFSMLLALMMVLTCLPTLPFVAQAETVASGTCGKNLTWVLTDDGILTISGTGAMYEYKNYDNIAPWKYYSGSVETVIINQGATNIGKYAFENCANLTSVVMPDSITNIGDFAFSQCTSMPSIEIPHSVTSIGGGAFYCCTNLASVEIPSSVTSIGNIAFEKCSNLTEIKVNNNPYYSNDQQGVLFNKDKTELISYPGGRTGAYKIPDSVTNIGYYAFADCIGLTGVEIPGSVTDIESGAFYNCDSLISLEIPESVISIGGYAFWNCTNLVELTFKGNAPSFVNDYVFEDVAATAYYPSNDSTWTEEIRQNYGGSITWVGYESGPSIIAEGTCGDNLTWVLIDEGILTISGTGAMYDYNFNNEHAPWFEYRESINAAVIEEGAASIGNYAFHTCTGLTNLEIPDSVTSIGTGAFRECTSLNSMEISSYVTRIGEYAFDMCASLKEIRVHQNNQNYSSDQYGVLFNKNKTKLICYPGGRAGAYEIPASVVEIEHIAFEYCAELTSVVIPDSVTNIGNYAFLRCTNLTNISIGNSVVHIGERAFALCDQLTEIAFEGNAPQFSGNSLYNITAKVYYPVNDATWTEEIQQNYGGSITWVPYDPDSIGGDDDKPPVEPPCTLEELRTLDYLAFAEIAYLDYEFDGTVKDCLTEAGRWDSYWDKDRKITYAQLCEHIAQWKVDYSYIFDLSSTNGFYAVPFQNDSGEVVLAYRGSEDISKVRDDWDAYCDWMYNDFPMELFNSVGLQYTCALAIYHIVEEKWGKENMVVTGHSLGGAWADVASAYSGCKGVTFNAVSVLDAVYNEKPEEMGRLFNGVNTWNFVDHTNKYDFLAGMFESYWSLSRIKPYTAHNSIYKATNIGGNHSLQSVVEVDSYGNLRLTETNPAFNFAPSKVVSNHLSFTQSSVDFGTSWNDTINKGLSVIYNRSSFGGDGVDKITTSINADVLVGGRHDDILDGGFGNDVYIYYKNDGQDSITDIAGDDVLHLRDFAADDTFEIVDDPVAGFIDIKCNGDVIVRIRSKNRFMINSFRVYIQRGDTITEHDITKYFSTKNYGSHVLIACPVEIQILDADGNEVYMLQDGVVGNFYTDYGNFYVFEEEDGGHGKVLDLVEGYSAKIVGTDTGTMDITYQSIENGELSEAQTISDIPVSTTFEGFLVEEDDGNAVLKIVGDHPEDSNPKITLELPNGEFAEHSTVWIEGLPYAIQENGEGRYVELPTEENCYLVTYTYHAGDGQDVHTQYPTGMKVYKVSKGEITYIPELDDLLQYSGSSIRIVGKKGIRMITSLTKDNKKALTGDGLAGFKLLEYGTALCFASEIQEGDGLVLGRAFTRSNFAYKKGEADPVFASPGNLIQYTNVLVGFSLDQCKEDIAMRPYIILEDAQGNRVTLYGGTIYRSIGYIAYQNRSVFKPKTAAYNYVWELIHHVYGDKYDADFKG